MRKILSFVAAMFVALAVNAQELPSTDFAAPGYSCAADAAVLSGTATELSGKFYLDETASPHHIAWSDLSKQYTAVATWRFHASRACYVTVTLDLGPVIASNKHIFDVELHAANGDRLDTIAEGPNYTGDGFTNANVQKTLEGQILIPAAGDYYIELRNNRDWCKGSIKNVILTYAADAPIVGAPAYYLVGNMNNWTPDSAYKFAVNPANENEYMFNTTLAVGDSVKVLGIVGNTQTWYPDNAPNYGVDAAHAGEKTIYFQTTYKADWAEFGGYMWMEANPQPKATLDFTVNTTWNFPTDAKAVAAAAFSDGTYSITLEGTSGNGYRWYSNGNYLLNGKEGATITLPAFTWKTTKIVVTGNSGASGSTKMNIFVGNSAVSTETTGSKGVNTYEIAEAYQAPGNVYVLKVTSDHNAQFTKIEIYGEDAPEPQGCDWDNIEFLGGPAEYANQFKVCVGDPAPTQVVNIQQPGWAAAPGIFMSFPAAPITAVAPLAEDQYAVDGAGVVLYVSAFTAKETEVTITANNVDYVVTVLNVNGTEPQPEVNYSLKNNWDAAADWTWKEMTKDGDNYKLENVVFGGTGVNYQADLPGAPEIWVPMDKFLGDKVDAKDTVTFVLNPADSTITATLIGEYIEPVPEPVIVYNWSNGSTQQIGTQVYGTEVSESTVKIYKNTLDINAIKFNSSYKYSDGKYLTIKPAEGGFKAGDILFLAPIFSNADTLTKFAQVDVYAADGSTRLFRSDSASTINGRVSAADPIVQAYTLESDQDSLLLGRYGNTAMYVSQLYVTREAEPIIGEPDFYLVGSMNNWTPAEAYKFAKTEVEGEYTLTTTLAAGDKFKVKGTGSIADTWYPEGMGNDYEVTAAYAGEKTIYFRPAGNPAWEAFHEGGFFYMEVTPAPAGKITCDSVYNLAKNDTAALAPVVVTYVNGKNVYVMDATAGMLLYLPANGTWKIGDQLTGVEGVVDIYNGIHEVKLNAAQVAAVTADSGAVPQPVKVDSVTMKDMSKFILVEGIEFDTDTAFVEGKQANITIVVAGDSIVLRNNFKNGYEFKAGKKYNIAALVTLYYGKLQLYFVTAEEQATIAYYVAGSMNGWAANEAYILTPNNESLYEGEFTFAANDEFKVIGFNGKTTTWYPDGMGNNFKITEAGDYKITFNPAGNVEGWYAGYFNVVMKEAPIDTIPTTAPAAPTQAEEDVMAIYCDYYKTNNLHFGISGWAGAYETLNIEDTKIAYWKAMTWECVIDPVNTDSIHDLSGYKKLHVDFWAPAAAQIKLTAEAVAGGNYKDGVVLELAEGWTSWDIEIATWPGQYDFANLKCFALEGYKTPEGESFEGNPFAVANIYFYDKKAEGFENIDASVKAVKVLQNGQIFILRGDKVYTVTGQPIAK